MIGRQFEADRDRTTSNGDRARPTLFSASIGERADTETPQRVARGSQSVGMTDASDRDPGARAILLATKLHVPRTGGETVHRGALLAALSASRRQKLTLLSAPAGWGKTTLLAQWAMSADADEQVGWLSLDSSDNDPVWFWMYVIATLQENSPAAGARAVELLTMGADPIHVVLPTLLNDLDTIASPVVLILDDYHVVQNRSIHEQMAFFIGRMPDNLHLVLATRSDPMLPLARLRAGGELAELRSSDLRFDVAATGHLLNDVFGLNLSEPDIELLQRRTEGWVAGLYLAALSLAGRRDPTEFIRTFAGDNRHIVDYLMAEVLDNQPPDLRAFLLHTSILGRLSGALCDAVLQTSGSAMVLERIEGENLFLVPLDMARQWYRYHHLFGELLRTELDRSEPELVAVLHRRAADWFESEGLVDEAVRHLIAAGHTERGAELIVGDWDSEFRGGGVSTVSGWLDLLPAETVSRDPRLGAIRAWTALSTGAFDDARAWIEVVGTRCAEGGDDGLDAQRVALREVYAFKTGDLPGALAQARRAVDLDFHRTPHVRSTVLCTYGSALYFARRVDEAEATFGRVMTLAKEIGDRRGEMCALGYLALIAAESGRRADAEHHIRRATGVATDSVGGQHGVDAMLLVAAATVLDARGLLRAAAETANLAVSLAQKNSAAHEVAKALLIEAEILDQLGEHDAATANRSAAGGLLGTDAAAGAVPALALPEMQNAVNANSFGEELTAKEHEVLRLLASPLSRREIGARLYVSLNTVKTHQRSLYRKLGVDSRGAAVDRARELGLL